MNVWDAMKLQDAQTDLVKADGLLMQAVAITARSLKGDANDYILVQHIKRQADEASRILNHINTLINTQINAQINHQEPQR